MKLFEHVIVDGAVKGIITSIVDDHYTVRQDNGKGVIYASGNRVQPDPFPLNKEGGCACMVP